MIVATVSAEPTKAQNLDIQTILASAKIAGAGGFDPYLGISKLSVHAQF